MICSEFRVKFRRYCFVYSVIDIAFALHASHVHIMYHVKSMIIIHPTLYFHSLFSITEPTIILSTSSLLFILLYLFNRIHNKLVLKARLSFLNLLPSEANSTHKNFNLSNKQNDNRLANRGERQWNSSALHDAIQKLQQPESHHKLVCWAKN